MKWLPAPLLMLLLASPFRSPAEREFSHAVFKSVDRGRSWTRSSEGLPATVRINVLAATETTLLVGTDRGVHVSADQGATWKRWGGLPAHAGRVLSLASQGGAVFAGTDGSGLWVASEPQAGWRQLDSFSPRKVLCMVAEAGRLHVGTDADGVLASDDQGVTWTRLGPGFPAGAQAFSLSMCGGTLFAGLYSRGLYAWDPGRGEWVRKGAVTPLALASVDASLAAGHNPGGIKWSEDGGSTWSQSTGSLQPHARSPFPTPFDTTLSQGPVWQMAAGHGLMLAGVSGGIHYSEDKGRTWSTSGMGLPEETPGVAFVVTRDAAFAAVTQRRPGAASSTRGPFPR